jgi:hypothetical protein
LKNQTEANKSPFFRQGAYLRLNTLLTAAGLFVGTLVLFSVTLAPSVVNLFDDSLEFQLVTYQLGIAHPTGYPLYTLLGKLFTLLPIGNIAYRVNWMSAVFGAITVALLYILILSQTPPRQQQARFAQVTQRWPASSGAAIGALLMALGLVFWQQATIAEVYSLNAFFVVVLMLAVVTFPFERPAAFYGLAFLVGLSLTHHRTMLLLLPAIALYLLATGQLQLLTQPIPLLLSIFTGALPLLLYLYLPVRGEVGSLDGTYQNSWSGFWQHITASGYGTFIFDNPFGQERVVADYWNLVVDQFYTPLLGLIGLLYLARYGQLKYLLLTASAFVTYFVFNLFYNVADIEVFFIPVFLIWAIWSGLGAVFLLKTAISIKKREVRYLTITGLLIVFAVIIGQLFRTNLSTVRQQYTWRVHDYGIDMLRQPLEQGSVIVGILGETTLVRYFQQTEGLRPDVVTVAADQEDVRLTTVARLLGKGETVYLTRELPGAAEKWSMSAVGPLIQVLPEQIDQPPPVDVFSPALSAVTPEISLHGYTVSRVPHTGPGQAPVRITVVWQAQAPIEANLKVSARLLTQAAGVVAITDVVPVHFAYPTQYWQAGAFVTDVYDLTLPPDFAGQPLVPVIIWYNPSQNAAEVGRVELPAISP